MTSAELIITLVVVFNGMAALWAVVVTIMLGQYRKRIEILECFADDVFENQRGML